MAMKLFIPAVGYRIKLTKNWTFSLYGESRNKTMFEYACKVYSKYISRWGEKLQHTNVTVPANTVLEVDRVYVRTANKSKMGDDDYDSVTFKFVDSKKKVRFWAKLTDVNEIEYELPPDHTASKTAAQERAKELKKLTPNRVTEIVGNAIYTYTSKRSGTVPSWMNDEVVAGFKLLEKEYTRLFEPYERTRHENDITKRRAQLELELVTGKLSLPVGLADKVKTLDDLRRFGFYNSLLCDEPYERRGMNWEYVVVYRLLARCGYKGGSRTFERLPDGTCCRTFRPAPPDRHLSWEKDQPSVNHMWIKVYSDKDDVEITRVESGFDTQDNVSGLQSSAL